jgi:hypothetical protein
MPHPLFHSYSYFALRGLKKKPGASGWKLAHPVEAAL